MSGRKHVCLTFVGDITRDSRALRFARALAERYSVSVYALGGENRSFSMESITVNQYRRCAPDSLRRSLWSFWREVRKELLPVNIDMFLAADLYSLPLAALSAHDHGARLIYDSRELYSSIAALQNRKVAQFYWNRSERKYAARAARITTVNESIAEALRKKYRTPIVTVYNFPDIRTRKQSLSIRERLGLDPGKKILLSQGGLQEGRGAFLLVESLAELRECNLVFLGSGKLKYEILRCAAERGVSDRTFVIDAVASDELLSVTGSADIGMCLIEGVGESYRNSLPNKLFEYIVAGLPVVASDFPEIRKVVRASQTGILVDPSDKSSVLRGIRTMLTDADLYEKYRLHSLRTTAYLWENEETKLLSVVEEVCSP